MDLAEFVQKKNGKRVIRRVLISNNGLACVKCIRSLRKWQMQEFGQANLLKFIVMATPEDIDANAEYVRLADELIQVSGEGSTNNYSNVSLIVDLAERYKADAVWPGWGHSSENPLLPELLSKRGIKFIGPNSTAMSLLGDKISSTIIAQSAKVPCVAWSGAGVEYKLPEDASKTIPDDIYAKCCVQTHEAAIAAAEKIGFPLMIKASEGGGGKGIRKVENQAQLKLGFEQVKKEVPGSPIFLMKLAKNNRHLEVQLIADEYNNAIALYSRDCSVQRRHQKIIEEGPVSVVERSVVAKMEECAVNLAESVKYSCAGTVEYLFENGEFYFLELNPRLQVEHPVTEYITQTNIPAIQLQIAMGIPLYAISDIRHFFCQEDINSNEYFDIKTAKKIDPQCHCVAARITAENPERGFQPTIGKIEEISFRNSMNCWGYFSVASNSKIHPYADSQFGHIFARGNTREEARRELLAALKDLTIRGDISNTVEYLQTLLQQDGFINNQHNTSWLDGLISQNTLALKKPSKLSTVLCGAIFTIFQRIKENKSKYLWYINRGQEPPNELIQTVFPLDLIFQDTKYILTGYWSGNQNVIFEMNQSFVEAEYKVLKDGGLAVLISGEKHIVYAHDSPSGLTVLIDQIVCQFQKEFDPSEVRSSMSGKLVRYLVEDGTHVDMNQPICELEIMKMIITLSSSQAGIIHFLIPEGNTLAQGNTIAKLDLDDKTAIKRVDLYSQTFTDLGTNLSAQPEEEKKASEEGNASINCLEIAKRAIQTVQNFLDGYEMPKKLKQQKLSKAVKELKYLLDYRIFFFIIIEEIGKRRNVIPKVLIEKIEDILEKNFFNGSNAKYQPVDAVVEKDGHILQLIENEFKEYRESIKRKVMNPSENDGVVTAGSLEAALAEFDQLMKPLFAIFNLVSEQNGRKYCFQQIYALVDSFCSIEKQFDDMKNDASLLLQKLLRCVSPDGSDSSKKSIKDLENIFNMNFSHARVASKCEIMRELLIFIENNGLVNSFLPKLSEMSSFISPSYAIVVLISKQLIMQNRLPTFKKMQKDIELTFQKALLEKNQRTRIDILKELIDVTNFSLDVLLSFFDHESPQIRDLANEVLIRKNYVVFDVKNMEKNIINDENNEICVYKWTFIDKQNEFPFYNSQDAIVGSFSVSENMDEMNLDDNMDEKHEEQEAADITGCGLQVSFNRFEQFSSNFTNVLDMHQPKKEKSNIVNIILKEDLSLSDATSAKDGFISDQYWIKKISSILEPHIEKCKSKEIRRITVAILIPNTHPLYFTFRSSLNYAEDSFYRHIEPALAFQLFLRKMSNYDISKVQTVNPQVHVYFAKKKKDGSNNLGDASLDYLDNRFFVRSLVLQGDILSEDAPEEFQFNETEKAFQECLRTLELIMSDPSYGQTFSNHIFINFLPKVNAQPNIVTEVIERMQSVYAERLASLRVSEVEMKFDVRLYKNDPSTISMRFVATNTTGYSLYVDIYQEIRDPLTGITKFVGLKGNEQPLHGLPSNYPYPTLSPIQQRRVLAQFSYQTSYAYDYPFLFQNCLKQIWKQHAKQRSLSLKQFLPSNFFQCKELVLDEQTLELRPSNPPMTPGSPQAMHPTFSFTTTSIARSEGKVLNKYGMIVFILTMKTPEYPEGRDVVVVVNDITHQSGSFGPMEDLIFYKASQLSRKERIPKVYIAANSGARIGLGNEVKDHFKVEWIDPENPQKGFQYFYVDEESYQDLKETNSILADPILIEGTNDPVTGESKKIYRITDIIGKQHGIGVENLKGSGMIAGETSKAYSEVFTISYVASRTVGIGAYLVRLGQRVVQNAATPSPIILTGAAALNKVLGREVYSSNNQIGGTQIMFNNGVSHLIANGDNNAINAILNWLSFVPAKCGKLEALPLLTPIDSPDRVIDVIPDKNLDIRDLLSGHDDEHGQWKRGFFDKGSWFETLSGWAKNVVVARARLGGIPIGVICVSNKIYEQVIPADPADSQSQERILYKPGPVWFPDSAFKTAQAINDFHHGEQLPMIIFANWRGFSGGQRDMFEEILKFGSYIVDALSGYTQPVFIYIPPGSELRGGAWVVLDSTINSDYMEMYADPTARGGVLEAAGVAEIKFKKPDILQTMHRLDDKLKNFDKELSAILKKASNKSNSEAEKEQKQDKDHKSLFNLGKEDENKINELKKEIIKREKLLFGTYSAIAEKFCDLHDTPNRMKQKKCILDVVEWKRSRHFFFWRLKRRLVEDQVLYKMERANPDLKFSDRKRLLRSWFEQMMENSSSQSSNSFSKTHKNKKSSIEKMYLENERMLRWYEDHKLEIEVNIQNLKENYMNEQVKRLCNDNFDQMITSLTNYIAFTDETTKTSILKQLRAKLLFFGPEGPIAPSSGNLNLGQNSEATTSRKNLKRNDQNDYY